MKQTPTPSKKVGVDIYKDSGLDYKTSSRAQKIAKVPEAKFEAALRHKGGWVEMLKENQNYQSGRTGAEVGAVPK